MFLTCVVESNHHRLLSGQTRCTRNPVRGNPKVFKRRVGGVYLKVGIGRATGALACQPTKLFSETSG